MGGSVRRYPASSEGEDGADADDERCADADERSRECAPLHALWVRGEPVDLWFVHEQIERVQPAQDLLIAVEIGVGLALRVQLVNACMRLLPEIVSIAKDNRLRRAGLYAGR